MVTTTKYVWDPVFDCVTHELDENNAVKAVYHNEPQQYGGVLSQRRGNTSHYHHHDAMGSTRFLTDSSGTVTDTYLNDAWGNSVASTGTTVNPFRWVGKYGYYTDNSTGQIYIRARMYQPTVARWASIDPLILQSQANADQQQNGYMHSVNTVTMLTDPSGLWVFLGGRGSLEGNFGPGDTSSYGDAHSEVGITFRPDKGAFGPTCPHCTLVRFVQIFFMDVRVINSTLPIRQWTLDPYKGVPPYYPDGFWANPSVNRGASSMFDDPNFQSLWKTASGTILSIDFETCAVCSDSSGGPGTCVGEVYACMTWGHSFVLAGPWWNKRITGWKRYVESDIWSSDDDIVVGRKNDPTHKFEGIASEPTKNMTPFLDKYFQNLYLQSKALMAKAPIHYFQALLRTFRIPIVLLTLPVASSAAALSALGLSQVGLLQFLLYPARIESVLDRLMLISAGLSFVSLFLSGTRILVRWHCLRQSSEFELVVFLVLLVLLAINVILMPAVAGA